MRATLALALCAVLAGCGGMSAREAALTMAEAPTLAGGLLAIYAAGRTPTFDDLDDSIRECVDDLDNGGDLEEALGESGLQCYCYHSVTDQISRNVTGYLANPVLEPLYCEAQPEPPPDFPPAR